MEPFVSIILVNYNTAEHTLECVDSLNNIDYKNYEIVIVDNLSRTEDVEKLNSITNSKVTVIKNKENSGFSGGNNLAIKMVLEKSDYILLLNNDTTVEKDFLNIMINKAESESDIGVVCPKIFNYYNRTEVSYGSADINYFKGGVFIYGINEKNEKVYNTSREITFATGCCMLIKAETLRKTGLLPEEYFLYFEDTDYSMKVMKSGYKMWYEPMAVIYHKESVSTEKCSPNYQYYFSRNRFMFIKKNFELKNKITAYPVSFMYIVKSILKGDFDIKNSFAGLRDFLIGKTGKRK
jgi:hypothetical protein